MGGVAAFGLCAVGFAAVGGVGVAVCEMLRAGVDDTGCGLTTDRPGMFSGGAVDAALAAMFCACFNVGFAAVVWVLVTICEACIAG